MNGQEEGMEGGGRLVGECSGGGGQETISMPEGINQVVSYPGIYPSAWPRPGSPPDAAGSRSRGKIPRGSCRQPRSRQCRTGLSGVVVVMKW